MNTIYKMKNLSKDIKYSIGLLLSLQDVHYLACCNKSWVRLLTDDHYWQRRLLKDYPYTKSDSQTFKEYYKTLYQRPTLNYDWVNLFECQDSIVKNVMTFIDIE